MRSSLPSANYALALHTTTPELGLAIGNFAGDTRAQTWNLGRETSSYLHQFLAEFLQPQTWADLAFVAVANGPGGFTGTRIGVVTARTLAQQLNIPLFAISTLAAVAWQTRSPTALGETIAVQMRAQRGEVFGAIYQVATCGLEICRPDAAMSVTQWQQILEQENPDRLVLAADELGATVNSILALAEVDWQHGKRPQWSEVLPFYGQHPIVEPGSNA
jgi:tRNA threonylcarbamoyl adenosine modification protein YeaZ